MPMVILYIPEILIGYKKVVNKLKIIPSLVLCLMLVAYIPSIDYRATSINRYLDGSSILMVSKENLYNVQLSIL